MNQHLIGQTVYDSEGNELGTVKEVRGDAFKVDAPAQPDYWLRAAAARDTSGRLMVDATAERYRNPDDIASGTTGTGDRYQHRDEASTSPLPAASTRMDPTNDVPTSPLPAASTQPGMEPPSDTRSRADRR